MNNNERSFSYSYSARQQAELKKIREKYISEGKPEADKLARIRRLDASVHTKATTSALILGIISTLIMGCGMSFIMTELGEFLGIWRLPVSIATGLIGIVGVILAYPLYNAISKRERKKIAPEILRLTDELINE